MAWSTLLIGASTAVSAMGAISQGNAQAASYRSQAAADTYNAQVTRDNAARTSHEFSLREDNLRRQQAQFLGRQRAGFAEAGIGTGGSAADVMEEDTVSSSLDALTLRYEGQTQRTAMLNQANLFDMQAAGANANAKQARKAGYIGALGSVLGGVGRYSSANPGYDTGYGNGIYANIDNPATRNIRWN